jgi:predicted nucleotidyltransferase
MTKTDYNNKEILENFVKRVCEEFGSIIVSIVLFGSVARGTAGKNSDIDVLIIYDEGQVLRKDFRDRLIAVRSALMHELLEATGCPDIFSLPFLSTVFMSRSEADNTPYLLLDVVDEGIVLFDPEGYFTHTRKRILKCLKRLGAQRYFLEDGTWYWNLKPDARLNELITI